MLKLRKIKNVTLSIAKGLRNNSKGIGLIETMIAILLLGIVAVAFLSGISTAFKALLIADERSTAQSLALSQMEYVKNQDYNETASECGATYNKTDIPEGYSIKGLCAGGYYDTDIDYAYITNNITGVPWDTENLIASTNDTGIQKITVIIYHPYDDNPDKTKRVLTLQDYKLDR